MEVREDRVLIVEDFSESMARMFQSSLEAKDAMLEFRRIFHARFKRIAAQVLREPPPKWRRKQGMYRSLHRTVNRRIERELD